MPWTEVAKRIDVSLEYPRYAFAYTPDQEKARRWFLLSISTDKAARLARRGGRTKHGVLSARILRTLLLNGRQTGTIPHLGCRHRDRYQRYCEPTMAVGRGNQIAPDAPSNISLSVPRYRTAKLMLFDGRNKQAKRYFHCAHVAAGRPKPAKITEWFAHRPKPIPAGCVLPLSVIHKWVIILHSRKWP